MNGNVRYFKILIIVGIKGIERICVILYDSKQLFCLLFSHDEILSEHILQQAKCTLQIFTLLFRNSITIDYVPFEHILLEDRGSPLSEGGCFSRINPIANRNYSIKIIELYILYLKFT